MNIISALSPRARGPAPTVQRCVGSFSRGKAIVQARRSRSHELPQQFGRTNRRRTLRYIHSVFSLHTSCISGYSRSPYSWPSASILSYICRSGREGPAGLASDRAGGHYQAGPALKKKRRMQVSIPTLHLFLHPCRVECTPTS